MKITNDKIETDFPFCNVYLECGEGWYPLIWSCMKEIQKYCSRVDISPPKVLQIKEKFGGLRMYLAQIDNSGENPLLLNSFYDIMNIVERYELISSLYCQMCGKAINERTRVNYHAICESCSNIKKNK